MKTFYLLRHEDLHGHSGLGVVAEGVIFDNGMVAMTWLSEWKTMTTFPNIQTVRKLHSHEGRTEIIIQGKNKKWETCQAEIRQKKLALKHAKPQP